MVVDASVASFFFGSGLARLGDLGRIATGEYRALVGISDVTAYRDLKGLCKKGLLVRHGKGRGTYYILTR